MSKPTPWTTEIKINERYCSSTGKRFEDYVVYRIWGKDEKKDEKFVTCLVGDDEETKANARLIAAAPEMLEMLKRLSRISTLDEKWDHELLELITKAEGREA